MINYPFVYPSAKENAPDVFKEMRRPSTRRSIEGKPSAPPLGGINIGVSAFSQHKDVAFEAIECLVKPENQLEVAELGRAAAGARRTSTTDRRSRRSTPASPS